MIQPTETATPRLAFVIGSPRIGGAERQVSAVARALHAGGHLVEVFVLERPWRNSPEQCVDFGEVRVRHLWFGPGREALAGALLRWYARRVDVVHLYNLESIELGARAWSTPPSQPTLVGSLRNIRFTEVEEERSRLAAALPRLARMSCNSTATRTRLVEQGLMPEHAVEVLPNLVILPTTVSRPSASSPVVLFAGTLKDVKDPHTFLSAAAQVDRPGVRWQIVGDGPLRAELEARASELGIQVEFLGRVAPSQVPYAECDLVVNSSIREGASNALLEALAHGVPVVATRVGGSVEIVDRSRGGVLVPRRDPPALAAAVQRELDDPELRRRQGERGREYILAHHSEAAVLAAHLGFYQRARLDTISVADG